jgi:hypothetical protein
MALLSLCLLDPPAAPSAGMRRVFSPLRLSFPKVDRTSFPGRAILCSFLTHVMAVCGMLFLPAYAGMFAQPSPKEFEVAEILETRQVIYLPRLGGGSEGNGYPGGGSATRRKGTSAIAASTSKGVTYPGPQVIVSDPPKPTNNFQTLMRPALKNPPVLKSFVPMPNIVQTTNAGPFPFAEPAKPVRPALPLTELKPRMPVPVQPDAKAIDATPGIVPPGTTPVDLAKLTLPSSAPQRPALPDMTAPKSAARAVQETPTPVQFSPVPTQGTDLQNLLALSPAPAPPDAKAEIPVGESRGRFAISPEANQTPSAGAPGSRSQGSSSSSVTAIGSETGGPSGNAAGVGPTGVSNGIARLAVGGEGGLGTNTGSGTGSGNGGTGSGSGRGSATGAGLGAGPGTSLGIGTGAGAGSGGGAFPGITIQGGSQQTGTAANSATMRSLASVAPRGSYGMTIVATASSGGGLPDFGVFSHEGVYTVYVDMRRTVGDRAPSWILQCAVLQGAAGQADTAGSQGRAEGFAPPFPLVKPEPEFPAAVVRKNLSKMIVVYAIINNQGKLEQMSVKQSPDSELNGPLLETLGKWAFQPAQLNGKAVAVKALLGVPLSLPQ